MLATDDFGVRVTAVVLNKHVDRNEGLELEVVHRNPVDIFRALVVVRVRHAPVNALQQETLLRFRGQRLENFGFLVDSLWRNPYWPVLAARVVLVEERVHRVAVRHHDLLQSWRGW